MSTDTSSAKQQLERFSFAAFAKVVNKAFVTLTAEATELFVVDSDKDIVCKTYIEAFPPGTNPLFRVRTEHECSTCNNFLGNLAGVVAISDNRIKTIWDPEYIGDNQGFYGEVAAALRSYIVSLPIRTIFRSKEPRFGMATTPERREGLPVIRWSHFHGEVPHKYMSDSVGTLQGSAMSVQGVLRRGLTTLRLDDLLSVQELIASNGIYRGQEFADAVTNFIGLKVEYDKISSARDEELFVWSKYRHPAARFLNTVIGTLVADLSEGVDIDKAVRSFEAKVAPLNYKRPTAVITPSMVREATRTLEENGLTTALDRRFAKAADISVNDVLFVDNSVRATMRDGLGSLLMSQVKQSSPKLDNAVDISIEDFVANVLPTAVSVDLFVTNQMQGNFMSMTAPQHADSGRLFKWGNDFAWSYDGNITDSIKQKVKQAGGNVESELRTSLAWFNTDDLDIHMHGPNNKHVYFGNKNGGYAVLDVDMNVSVPRRDAVENICWNNIPDGEYTISVNNFRKRESIDVGFVLEVEVAGVGIQTFSYNKAVVGMVKCLTITVKGGKITVRPVDKLLTCGATSQEKWGVTTEQFNKVDIVTISPNHWGGLSVGNKHWFFILRDCKNPEPTRGIYNEFLSSELEKHRKVFEILGDKTKCPVVDEQLSGVGFSSTKKDTATLSVTTASTKRLYKVSFAD